MADLNPSTTAAKVQRVSPSAPPSWSEECDRLLKKLGDDAAALEQAEHALAAVAAGTVDAAALGDPAIAALARHCEAASADEQSSRFGQAVSRLSYLHTNAEQKQAHRIASQTADEIREMVAQVTLTQVSVNSDAESDDDAIVDEGVESEDDSVQMLPAAADDSEEAGRRLALRLEAEKRAAARARRRSEEADAAFARRLAGADADQIESDAELARRLAQEDAPVDVIDVDAPVPPPIGPEPAPTPAKPPASVALVTPPTAPSAVRHVRIVIPGGAVLEMSGMPAGQPLGRFFAVLGQQLGLAPDDDPSASFRLVRLRRGRPGGAFEPHVGEKPYTRRDLLFNLGNDCTFHCGSPTHLRKSMKYGGLVSFGGYRDGFEFKSGDALVFNGAHAHQAMHGLSSITMGTNPLRSKAWLEKTRVSLQIRQL